MDDEQVSEWFAEGERMAHTDEIDEEAPVPNLRVRVGPLLSVLAVAAVLLIVVVRALF